MSTKKKQNKKPAVWKAFLYLLLIPAQIGLDVLLFYGGLYLDGAMYNPDPNQPGHAVPIFTGLAVAVASLMTLAIIVLALILTIVSLVRRRKKLKQWKQEAEATKQEAEAAKQEIETEKLDGCQEITYTDSTEAG